MTIASSILVLSSCTARKAPLAAVRPVAAQDIYVGQQHVRLMRGIGVYRDAGEPLGPLDFYLISARYGVVAAETAIGAYNATFTGMGREHQRRLGGELAIPQDVGRLLREPRRFALVLLGEHYLRAAALSASCMVGAPTLLFVSPGAARHLPRTRGLYAVTLDNRDATRFSCGLAALKGELAARLLMRVAKEPHSRIPVRRGQLLRWLEDDTVGSDVARTDDEVKEAA
jgi:hypothetical protein